MARPRILPDADVLAKLRREGKTYQEIADAYAVTKAAVHVALARSNLIENPRPRYEGAVPWEVKADHSSAWPLVQLRHQARRSRGGQLSSREERYLDRWLDNLRRNNAVVAYDPTRPKGFYYVERRPEDGDGLVHKPQWMIDEEAGNHSNGNGQRKAPRKARSRAPI